MSELIEAASDLLPPNPIRVETGISRYPIHRIAKHGEIAIDIREWNENGEVSIKWRATYNTGFGQPGPLAYKLDTLIINRRIEEACRPIPRLIRLGSLRDITDELGLLTHDTNIIKKSLHQNASVYITAKIRYRQSNGAEQTLETGFTRYQVIFTGEKLPDGRTADSVYIVLSDAFMQVINGAMTRPLDYDYLKSLAPAPQRFYELLSYQMYAAIKNDRSRAKLLYSEFCRHAPLTRHVGWEQARRQLAKIHAPHRKSGYIGKIDFERTVDGDGIADWIMLYQPGPKARSEYRAFTKRGGPVMLEVEPLTADVLPQLVAPAASPLVAKLTGLNITAAITADLIRDYDAEKIRQQIEILEWMQEKKPGKITDPAAWLVIAIRNGHAVPKGFTPAAERQKQAADKQAKDQAKAEAERGKREAHALELADKAAFDAYVKQLSKADRTALEAKALAATDPEARARYDDPGMARFRDTLLVMILRDYLRPILRKKAASKR